ncbi:GGDEF domain-containing protein [Rubrivivax gelatinosus]|uniref:diguanylate cyclase n=1 Tax=Rubrivivax gelatinosus TaxID=28068 RepID=A0ABS1DYI8_RUBGE|nr:GGDEF domain-containing protein [Rubrivivax gelatinosus]MBK1715152.1 hypothetical protein [Rubrivivax gelatinosus]
MRAPRGVAAPERREAALALLAHLRQAFAQNRFDSAGPLVQALHAEALADGELQLAAEAALLLAKGHANREQPLPAQEWAERAIVHAQAAGVVELEASAWVLVASERARSQQPAASMQAVGHVLRLMAGVDDARAVATVFTGVTLSYQALGLDLHALEAARRALRAGLVLADESILLRLQINVVHSGLQAWDQLHEVEPAKAAALLAELRAPLDAVERTTAALHARGLPGRSSHDFLAAGWLARHGDEAAALALLQTLTTAAADLPPGLMSDAWLLLGELLRRRGEDPGAAAEAACQLVARCSDGGAAWLQRAARAEELAGRAAPALALLRRSHARQLATVRAALDERIDELAARLVELQLRDENRQLRAHNQGLEADVRHVSLLAGTDALTGLPNRRALEAAFDARGDGGQVLAVLDLDHFKSINDRFSHLVGDAVLQAAAAQMAASLRAPDLLARLGGEEFVALLDGVSLADAASVLERVRLALHGHDWAALAEGLKVTVSIGVTRVLPGEPLPPALARADALLYRAKHEGRDRVVLDPGMAG